MGSDVQNFPMLTSCWDCNGFNKPFDCIKREKGRGTVAEAASEATPLVDFVILRCAELARAGGDGKKDGCGLVYDVC